MISFVLQNAPKRQATDIYCLAADGFVNQNMVTEDFKLPNATFILDQFHLFDSILPKRFGRDTFDKLKADLHRMASSLNSSQFENAYGKAQRNLVLRC